MKHLVIRSEREQNIATAGKIFGAVFACAATLLFFREIPSLIRYARMEMM
jgi:hypothetical protein